MNIGICILLFYITPMLLCLVLCVVVNWKDIKTVGDLLCPLDGEVNTIIYLPIINIGTLLFLILFGILSFLRQVFCEWTPIGKYIQRFLNTKIK